MDIHLVSIKVSIVRAAISVVHANGLLFWQDFCQVRHHRWLVQGWLTIHEQHVAIAEVSMHYLLADQELVSDAIPVLLRHILKQDLLTTSLIFNHICTRVHRCTISN